MADSLSAHDVYTAGKLLHGSRNKPLGGTPCFTDWPIHSGSSTTEMLKADIALEQEARARYGAQLETLQDQPQLHALITSVLSDEQEHEEEFSAYLARHVNDST